MMSGGDTRGWGKTVLGWFVEDAKSAPTSTDELIAKYAAEPSPAAPPVELKGELPEVKDGKVDFVQVFEQAGVDADERARVDRAQELLRSLPAETPAPVKKQIVEASLKAFGVATDKIIEAAVQEMEALEAFIVRGQHDTQSVLTGGSNRITDLERQIAEVRQVMQQAVTDQQTREKTANTEKLAIQDVLQFFGQEAVAKVVQDSPKLHTPA